MSRPRDPEKWKKVKVKCYVCDEITIRYQWQVDFAKKTGTKMCCSRSCGGKIGGSRSSYEKKY
jgi:hypothetical protein